PRRRPPRRQRGGGRAVAGARRRRALDHRAPAEEYAACGPIEGGMPRIGGTAGLPPVLPLLPVRRLPVVNVALPGRRAPAEGRLHPAVYRAITAGLRAFDLLGGAAFAVVDVPLLFETGHGSDFDRVIVTASPPELQRQRLVDRGLTEAEAEQRLTAQWPTAEKTSRADFVVRTDGSFEETARQVDEILQKLKGKS